MSKCYSYNPKTGRVKHLQPKKLHFLNKAMDNLNDLCYNILRAKGATSAEAQRNKKDMWYKLRDGVFK